LVIALGIDESIPILGLKFLLYITLERTFLWFPGIIYCSLDTWGTSKGAGFVIAKVTIGLDTIGEVHHWYQALLHPLHS